MRGWITLVVVIGGCSDRSLALPDPALGGTDLAAPDLMTPDLAVADLSSSRDLAPPADLASCSGSLDSDPHNCGACGHDCLGAGCRGGMCQPLMISSKSEILYIAVDHSGVYYTAGGDGVSPTPPPKLFRVQPDGTCAATAAQCPEMLASTRDTLVGISLDDDNVYVVDSSTSSLLAQPKSCTQASCQRSITISTAKDVPEFVVGDSDHLFVPASDGLFRIARDLSSVTRIAAPAGDRWWPFAVVMSGGNVIVASARSQTAAASGPSFSDGFLVATSSDGATSSVIFSTSDGAPMALLADASGFFFTSEAGANAGISHLPAGATSSTLLVKLTSGGNLAADADHLYFGDGSLDHLNRINKDGSGLVTLDGSVYVSSLAVDDRFVYYANVTGAGEGVLYRVAK